jgi:hypothetical protein
VLLSEQATTKVRRVGVGVFLGGGCTVGRCGTAAGSTRQAVAPAAFVPVHR